MTEPSELERIAEIQRYLNAIDVQRQRAERAEREVARLAGVAVQVEEILDTADSLLLDLCPYFTGDDDRRTGALLLLAKARLALTPEGDQ